MRIALLSTCALSTPPAAYGGTELVVADLATGLVRLGHDVTVFATGDSRPAGELRSSIPAPVWPPSDLAELRHAAVAWREIASAGFDVVHVNHAAALALQHVRPVPCIMTIHHPRDRELLDHYRAFPDATYVAIARRQLELMPEVLFTAVVHHGLDERRYVEGLGDGGYVAFLGRFAPEKGPHLAIDAAVRAGVPLKLGGAPHAVARTYFTSEVAPRLSRNVELVEWQGELAHGPKLALLARARALLFPIAWEEPFGLVMIEAMLVGTPVIAFPRGSVPEVVDEGLTGFVVSSVDEMAARIRALDHFDRARCRARALQRWTSLRMARDYVNVYRATTHRRRALVPQPMRPGARASTTRNAD